MTTAATQDADGPLEHWRAMHDSNSDDFNASDLLTILEQEGATELHVRIESAGRGSVKDFDTNKTKKKVAFKFAGIEKLYKSNVTNNNATSAVTGSPFPRRWTGAIVTLYVGKAERGRRKGDPEGTPSKVIVDAVRFRPVKPPAGAKVYGVAGGAVQSDAPPFDLDGWLAAFGDVTREEFPALREKLNATKRPKESREPLAKAVEAARARLFGEVMP